MSSKIEDLAIELWLELFTYLNIPHQFHAFFHLNKRLNQILFTYRTQISLKNNDEHSQYLFQHILPYLTHPEHVTGLRLENTNKIDLADKSHLLHFPRLTTLILHRLQITKDLINLFQQNTTHLRYLNISSIVSGNKQSMHRLLEMIISLPNLQFCHLRLGISMSPMPLKIAARSPIKDLRLMGMNENCLTDRLVALLQHLPCLQSLYIIANQLTFTPTANIQNISTASISIFTLNIKQFSVSFVEFANFISSLTPDVEELKIICRTPLENLNYLNHPEWMGFIESLSNLKKMTLDISRADGIDEQIWDKNCQKLTKLMTRKHIVLHIGK